MAKKSAKKSVVKAPTKSEMLASVADATGLSKKDVSAVLDAIAAEVKKAIGNRGVGMFVLPGLLKIMRQETKPRPAEKNWKNPFTGEIQTRPAKPAQKKVRVRPLKALRDMVAKG